MVYILSEDGRDDDFPHGVNRAFSRYREYLKANRTVFPAAAYELGTSEWFYNPRDHRSLHDAWLESFELRESPVDKDIQERTCSISLRLFASHHNGHIEITYPKVFSYSLVSFTPGQVRTHGDWRYDEFRLSERGRLIHEIEWSGTPRSQDRSFSWTIEADDIDFRWVPQTT